MPQLDEETTQGCAREAVIIRVDLEAHYAFGSLKLVIFFVPNFSVVPRLQQLRLLG